MAQTVRSLPAMQETWVGSLGQEDPLEKEMVTPLQYSCLENPHGQRSLAGYSPCCHRVRLNWVTKTFTFKIQTVWMAYYFSFFSSSSFFSTKNYIRWHFNWWQKGWLPILFFMNKKVSINNRIAAVLDLW